MTRTQRFIVILAAALIAIRIIWPVQHFGNGAIVSYWPQPVDNVPPAARRVVDCNISHISDLSTYDFMNCAGKSGRIVVEGHTGHYTFNFGPKPYFPIALGVTMFQIVGILVVSAAAFVLAQR